MGRRGEIDDLTRILGHRRLVTLVGPGGCGKSRLSLEVASRLTSRFRDGAAFVDLAPVHDPALVAEVAAAAVGASRGASSTVAGVIGDAELLLVVDNAEHLVDAVAALLADLLARCPNLKALVSSRELLDVAGEVSWSVPRLSLPRAGAVLTPRDLLTFDAIELFCARAAEHQSGFRLTRDNAELVVAICRRVDGIPLALELAAARVRSLALAEIATRLSDSFRLLTGGPRSAVDRHRTLGATVEWSYQLLTETERRLFRRLALFVSTFDVHAVESICSDPDLPGDQIADVLQRLVDKSLVVANPRPDGDLRYSLIEPIRQYGQDRLQEAGESALRARHARHYARLVAELAADEGDLRARVEKMTTEYDNVRVALDWAADQDPEMEFGMIVGLRWFWYVRGSVVQAIEAVLFALGKPHGSVRQRVRLHVEAANWLRLMGELDRAQAHMKEGSRLLGQLDDPELIGRLLRIRGTVRGTLGDHAGSEADLSRAADVLKRSAACDDLVLTLNNLAMTHLLADRPFEALEEVEQLEAIIAVRDQLPQLPHILHTLGAVYLAVGRIPDARLRFLRGLECAVGYDNYAVAVMLLNGLACVAAAGGAFEVCLELLAAARRSAQLAGIVDQDTGTPDGIAERKSRAILPEEAAVAASARGSRLDLRSAYERARGMDDPDGGSVLTARKREVVRLVAEGLTNRQIAERMSISERTVDAHLEQARNQLGLHNRAQMVAWAMREGLMDSEGTGRRRASGE